MMKLLGKLVIGNAIQLAIVKPPDLFGETSGDGAGKRLVHLIQTGVERVDGMEHLGFRELGRKRAAVFRDAVMREDHVLQQKRLCFAGAGLLGGKLDIDDAADDMPKELAIHAVIGDETESASISSILARSWTMTPAVSKLELS